MSAPKAVCAVCREPLSPPVFPMLPQYHFACGGEVVKAIRAGCPVCGKPVTAKDCVLDNFNFPKLAACHEACRSAEIDENVNAGLDQNVREGLAERRVMPDGSVQFRVTEKGIAYVRDLINGAQG